MRIVFLDTVGLIAVWDEDDQWHTSADKAYQMLLAERVRFVTTDLILYECGNAAARRPYRKAVAAFRHTLASRGDLVIPTDDDIRHAWDAYNKGPAGDAGIIDHISFQVMRRLGIREVFSNDRHFHAAGLVTLF